MGHFYLTTLLLDKITKSEEGRIVNLSSLAHTMGKMRFHDMGHEKSYDPWIAYFMSKLANVLFTKHLANMLESQGKKNVKVVSLHPGYVRTDLMQYYMHTWRKVAFSLIAPLNNVFSKSPWQGTQTQLHCTLCPFNEL